MIVNALLVNHGDVPRRAAMIGPNSQNYLSRDVLDKCWPIVSAHRHSALVGPLEQRMDLR
jgi:hypothetical protein